MLSFIARAAPRELQKLRGATCRWPQPPCLDGRPRGHAEVLLRRRDLGVQHRALQRCPVGRQQVVQRRHVGAAGGRVPPARRRHKGGISGRAPALLATVRRSYSCSSCVESARPATAQGSSPPHQERVLSS